MNDLENALAYAEAVSKERFCGLKNTDELRQTVLEMFDGCSRKMVLENIEGSSSEFKANLFSDSETCDDINNIITIFEKNTLVTVKKSKYL